MSLPLTPFERWQEGTTQPRLPVNDNSLRVEIAMTNGIANDVTAQPGSPDDGDWYIIPAGATGAQWATFDEDSIAIFYSGTWHEFVPAQGNRVMVAGVFYIFDASDGWEAVTIPAVTDWPSITGDIDDNTDLVEALDDVEVVTEASAFDVVPATHAGRRRWILAGGDVTFDDGEAFAAGQVYAITATAAIELVEDGVTLTPPAGGTLGLDADMSVEVRMTSGTAGIVIGQTVAAP